MSQFQFPYQQTYLPELPAAIQNLIREAQYATTKAYAPYSRFRVGAAILLNNQEIITGANQENASYPAGICAERAALSSLNLNDKALKVLAIAVTYDSDKEDAPPVTPCGICRQYLLEVQIEQAAPVAVFMCSPTGQVIYIADAACLLPFSFSNLNLSSAIE